MNKKIKLSLLGILTLSCVTFVGAGTHSLVMRDFAPAEEEKFHVDFFDNYLREDFELSTGFVGRGNNLLYYTVDVIKNSFVSDEQMPIDPIRKNYDFSGWYKEEECLNEWHYKSEQITKNTRVFAKWTFTSEEKEDEPEFVPPSTVLEESALTNFVIDSIMHFEVKDNMVKLSNAALMKLEAQKDNVLPLMEYRVKANKNITASYQNKVISVTSEGENVNIQVVDDSLNLVLSNSTYENKAQKYEAKALEEDIYHVMLAGSSSIEFWESSKEDLDPVVSFNHGIGGTTIEEWDTILNKRLVFPYKPKMVVYYVGINNVINSKQSASKIWENLESFFNHTHEAMPNTKVQYIMMNLIPGFRDYFDTINEVNSAVLRYQEQNTWLTLINPGLALLKDVDKEEDIKNPGQSINMLENVILSANWEIGATVIPADKYTVSFDANGGTGEMADVTKVIDNYKLPECTFTAPTSKAFVGWKVNEEIKQPGATIVVKENTKLTAIWDENKYVVSFLKGSGNGEMADVTDQIGGYVLPECTFTPPVDDRGNVTGYKFVGYKINNEGNLLQVGDKITVFEDTYLVAQWATGKFTVRFDGNGGSGNMAPVIDQLAEYVLPECTFTAPAGKHFAGWSILGEPNAGYFRTDGLHLSHYGYVIWGNIIKQSILDGLKG